MSCSVSLTEKWGHWTVAKQPAVVKKTTDRSSNQWKE